MNKVVNLYKPKGPTSFDMVQKVKGILGVKKAGHIGTLDPEAEGMLPICLNRSTRIIPFLTSQFKVYEAEMKLGTATDTQDATGKVIAEGSAETVEEDLLRAVLKKFEGPQQQIPPMYSAKKKNGIPLYKLARSGITIERNPVPIHIYSIDLISLNDDRATFTVQCSSGTYIRTLCNDIGERLGCFAHMSRLIRTQVGIFKRETSVTLENLERAAREGELSSVLMQQEDALEFLPFITIKKDFSKLLTNGIAVSRKSVASISEPIRTEALYRAMSEDGRLLAVLESKYDEKDFNKLEPGAVAFKTKRVLI